MRNVHYSGGSTNEFRVRAFWDHSFAGSPIVLEVSEPRDYSYPVIRRTTGHQINLANLKDLRDELSSLIAEIEAVQDLCAHCEGRGAIHRTLVRSNEEIIFDDDVSCNECGGHGRIFKSKKV